MLYERRIRKKGSKADLYVDYGAFPTVFCLKINHGGTFTLPPKIRYKEGKLNWVDTIDSDVFCVVEVNNMMKECNDEDVIEDVSEDEWLHKSLRLVGIKKKHAIKNDNVKGQSSRNESINVEDDRDDGSNSDDEFEEEGGNHDELDSWSDSKYEGERKKVLKIYYKIKKANASNAKSSGTTWKENFYVGLKFSNSKEIKEMVTRVAVEQRRELHLKKNDKVRVRCISRGKVPQFCCEDGDDDSGSKGVVLSGSKGKGQSKEKGQVSGSKGKSNNKTKAGGGISKQKVFRAKKMAQERVEGPLKYGFKAGKRDLLGLDGCFLSGSYPGWILAAVGVDPNNGIYPLAYAIVESKNKDSWKWFLECVGDDLDLFRNSNFTFISDRQKGIIPAIAKSFPSAEHRFCLKHNYDNMKLSWRGRAHCDVLLNNTCEVFNRQLVDGRDKRIITCLEFIREYMMKRIVNVQKVISKSDCPLTLNATKAFNIIVKEAGQMKVIEHNQRKCPNDASAQTATQTQQSSQARPATQATQALQISHTTPFHPSQLHASLIKITKASAARRSST
nr:hypothetical protein [Tanacetum cinerariifolium]